MKVCRFFLRCSLLFVLMSVPWASVSAQQPTFLTPVEMNGQWLRGSAEVTEHGNDGMIGINGSSSDLGYKIETVTPGGPAARVGILPGDVITSIDGASIKGIDTVQALKLIAHKRAGETVNLTINRNGEAKTLIVVADTRNHMLANNPDWQKESKLPPGVGQFIFGGSAAVTAALFQTGQYPSDAFLMLSIYSKNAPAFSADDMKFFVLDGTGQQLRHVSLDEIKYGIQLSVAQNWKGGNYPPPPPPSPERQYTISGVENGDYTITDLGGGMGSISGTSSSTYTVTQQPDYNQLGYSLGLAIRKYRDAKSDKKLLEQANQAIASWQNGYFQSQSPVVPGESRNGEIMYWTGSNREPQPPFRVVLFLTDPRTQKQEHLTFAFGPGAEKIREEMASELTAAPAQPKSQVALSNNDVVGMVKAGIGPDIIVAKIKNSSCAFDTSPAALKQLKDDAVPDSVILVMVQAPKN